MASSNTVTSESSGDKRKSQEDSADGVDKKARTDDKAPLYSGDKLIPERFAEMKRVPKVPNAPGPRDYATAVTDERVKPLLIEMLGELMRLQKRAIEDKNAKARRRLVMGLREVARGIRAHKGKPKGRCFSQEKMIIPLRSSIAASPCSQNGRHGKQFGSVRSHR